VASWWFGVPRIGWPWSPSPRAGAEPSKINQTSSVAARASSVGRLASND